MTEQTPPHSPQPDDFADPDGGVPEALARVWAANPPDSYGTDEELREIAAEARRGQDGLAPNSRVALLLGQVQELATEVLRARGRATGLAAEIADLRDKNARLENENRRLRRAARTRDAAAVTQGHGAFVTALAASVRSARERAGVPTADAAAALGVSVADYTRLETGDRPIQGHELVQLADRFGVPATDLTPPDPAGAEARLRRYADEPDMLGLEAPPTKPEVGALLAELDRLRGSDGHRPT